MTEGVADTSKNSSPSYLNWARTLNHLLEDRDGVELFKKYVEEEAPAYNDHLNFYFACEGLKQQTDPEKINNPLCTKFEHEIRTHSLACHSGTHPNKPMLNSGMVARTPLL